MGIQMRVVQVPQGLRLRTSWPWFSPPKTRVCGKQQVVARETCEEQATHDDKLQLVIAKLKAKNESMTEESPEEVAKAAKFQHIIEKIKSPA